MSSRITSTEDCSHNSTAESLLKVHENSKEKNNSDSFKVNHEPIQVTIIYPKMNSEKQYSNKIKMLKIIQNHSKH